MSLARIDENTRMARRARVVSTLRRRQPLSPFSGPKFCRRRPSRPLAYVTLRKITSRSSPWMFSRFFTKNGSSRLRSKNNSIAGSSRRLVSSRSWMASCWRRLNVPTPSVSGRTPAFAAASCSRAKVTIASATRRASARLSPLPS